MFINANRNVNAKFFNFNLPADITYRADNANAGSDSDDDDERAVVEPAEQQLFDLHDEMMEVGLSFSFAIL